jgi:hypothetical protein
MTGVAIFREIARGQWLFSDAGKVKIRSSTERDASGSDSVSREVSVRQHRPLRVDDRRSRPFVHQQLQCSMEAT